MRLFWARSSVQSQRLWSAAGQALLPEGAPGRRGPHGQTGSFSPFIPSFLRSLHFSHFSFFSFTLPLAPHHGVQPVPTDIIAAASVQPALWTATTSNPSAVPPKSASSSPSENPSIPPTASPILSIFQWKSKSETLANIATMTARLGVTSI